MYEPSRVRSDNSLQNTRLGPWKFYSRNRQYLSMGLTAIAAALREKEHVDKKQTSVKLLSWK